MRTMLAMHFDLAAGGEVCPVELVGHVPAKRSKLLPLLEGNSLMEGPGDMANLRRLKSPFHNFSESGGAVPGT